MTICPACNEPVLRVIDKDTVTIWVHEQKICSQAKKESKKRFVMQEHQGPFEDTAA